MLRLVGDAVLQIDETNLSETYRKRALQSSAYRVRSLLAETVKVLGWDVAASLMKRPKGDDEKTHAVKIQQLREFLDGEELRVPFPRRYLKLALDLREPLRENDRTEAESLTTACSIYCSLIDPLGVDNHLVLPSRHSEQYRFRIPREKEELIPFQEFSDKEPDIAQSHEGLAGEKRRIFYGSWFERRPDVFLILDRVDERRNWEAVAVSIVLPLMKMGETCFAGGSWKR